MKSTFFNHTNSRLFISLLVAVCFFYIVYNLARFDKVFQYNSDEGFYFMRAFLLYNGFSLYDEIWLDQPPMLPTLLGLAFQWFEPSIIVARSLVLCIISLMLCSLFYIIYKTQNIFSSMITLILVCSIPHFIKFSVSAMNGLPAIAFAVIACLGIYFYEVYRNYFFLVFSAFFVVVGLLIKLFVIVFIPAIAIELIYIEYKHYSGRIGVKYFLSLAFWLICTLFIFGIMSWSMAVDYNQILEPYSQAKDHFSEQPFKAVFNWMSKSYGITMLALGSLMWFRKKSMKLFFIPLISTVIAFIVFSHHTPIWNHHRMILLIPAAWLASFGAYEFFSLDNWKRIKQEVPKRKYWALFKIGYIGLALILVVSHLPSNVQSALRSLNKNKKLATPEISNVINLINANKNSDTILVTDAPSFAFHTQIAIPPALSTISLKQVKTGLITKEKIINLIDDYSADMILWNRFHDLGEEVMQAVGHFYELAYQGKNGKLKLFFRRKLAGNAQLYKGFGGRTIGGKGGEVYTVTNLNPSGPGSLSDGIHKTGSREIRFAVSGTINLLKPLVIKQPYLTINGVSALYPGITLSGAGLVIEASEVIINNLKIRVGDNPLGPSPGTRDGISIHVPQGATEPIENVVIDHCSISWAVDENIGTWIHGDAELKNITISHNIISEGLKYSIHPEGRHSMGLLVGDNTQNVTIYGNVFAHNFGRNPQLKGGVNAEVVSNIMYNYGDIAVGLSNSNPTRPIRAQVINNYFIPGKDTKNKNKFISFNPDVSNDSLLFIENNHGEGKEPKDKWRIVTYKKKSKSHKEISKIQSQTPLWHLTLSELTFEQVLMRAGSFPSNRGQIDKRIISDVKKRTGEHINTLPY